MKNKLQNFVTSSRFRAITIAQPFLFLLHTTLAKAQGPQAWGEKCTSGGAATIQGFECLLANVFSVFIPLLGLVMFVMLLIGSFKYMTSATNAKGKEVAITTIKYTVYGLLLALSSYFILNVIAQFTGVTSILDFVIPDPDQPPQ